MAKHDDNESMNESDQGRRARYLISAAVLLLILIVGGIFVAIVLFEGNDVDTGEQGAPAIGSRAVTPLAAGPAR